MARLFPPTLALLALTLSACADKTATDTGAVADDGGIDDTGAGTTDSGSATDSGTPTDSGSATDSGTPDEEVCDGIDNDGDGEIDEGVMLTFYGDADGDGYGNPTAPVEACEAPEGHVEDATDCDDTDAAFHPGADEDDCTNPADYNCDGSVGYADADADGWAACEDCDDDSAQVHPDATEVCNEVDDDCDGLVDDDDDSLDTATGSTWYADADADGFGDAASTTDACEMPEGHVADATDCDDGAASIHPDATETCNELDDDCDGLVDDDDDSLDTSTGSTWYADADGDGFGDADSTVGACEVPSGYTDDDADCDDTDADVNPDGTEVCNELDDDCDGLVDDDDDSLDTTSGAVWAYADDDGDGYGDGDDYSQVCERPSGTVSNYGDCDDDDASVNPDALEICDGADNDCDGDTDGSDAWWDTAWAYRVPVAVSAASYDVDGPPIAVDIDFRAALDALGDTSAFDPDDMRVVLQDCDLDQPELPSQFLDAWVGVFDKASSTDDDGDEHGAVALLYDEDGDYSSLETLTAGTEVHLAVYFGGAATSPGYSTDLSATSTELSTGVSTATFDADYGGMLDALTMDGSDTLMSQTTSCCGNSIYSSSWGIDPQDDAGTLTLLEEGPVFAAVEASGSRADDASSYDYTTTYWVFAGRPELWSKVLQVTTSDSTLSHTSDYTSGVRPWESRQDAVAAAGTFETSATYDYADVSDGDWGVAWGFHQAPAYLVGLSNYDPYLIVIANDVEDAGTGTPGSYPVDTAYFDHVVQVVVPHEGSFEDVDDTLWGLMEGVEVAAGDAEAW